ncbi:MAG: hypothetical protein RBR50_05335, partial [Candidatus Izemoplasmatales bacterium]|nr:hypothetical protein [Candidatus Izemoplasmatales bacterium]
MFLFDFADYRDTLIIFGVVVLVIVLVYFIFFAPKNKSKGEVIVKHEEEHFELEEKFNENEINDEDFNEVQEETVVTPVLSEASVEAVAFEDESQEIEEIVSEEGVSVEDELNDEVVSSVEIEETIDKNSLDQETKDEVDQDINVELNDDDDEIEETV